MPTLYFRFVKQFLYENESLTYCSIYMLYLLLPLLIIKVCIVNCHNFNIFNIYIYCIDPPLQNPGSSPVHTVISQSEPRERNVGASLYRSQAIKTKCGRVLAESSDVNCWRLRRCLQCRLTSRKFNQPTMQM